MGDDIPGSRPDMAEPDVGGSITFDFDGHVRKVELDVQIPGATGGDPAHLEWSPGEHDPASPTGPGWMPHITDPNEPPMERLPPQPGWHRDPITGIDYPDVNVPASSSDAFSEPGDYPLPNPDEPTV